MKRSSKTDEKSLLTRYVATGDEQCFQELVDRYLGMVLGCARRSIRNRELAQEVAQNVFTVLAQKCSKLSPEVSLGAWLHRATVFEATRARRKESLRREKMTEFAKHVDTEPLEVSEGWHEAVPLLDAAVDRLPRGDRHVVVLRFFEGRTYWDIGARVGKSEEAIRKQVHRALGKLSRLLHSKGVAISVSALATGLDHRVLAVIPDNGLVGAICANAVSSATVPTVTTTVAFQKVMTIVATLGIALPMAALWGLSLSYAQESKQLEGKNQRLRDAAGRPSLLDTGRRGSRELGNNENAEGVDLQKLKAQLRQLEQRPHEVRSLFRTLALIYQLSEEQLPAAFEMFQSSPLTDSEPHIHEALFTRWAKFDPREATKRTKEVRWHSGRLSALEGVIKEWVVHDSEAALATMNHLELGSHQKEWIRGPVVSVLVAHDPREALAQLPSASGALRSNLLSTLSKTWTKQDPEAALSWAAGLEGDDRDKAFPVVINQLAKQDPALALESVLEMENLRARDLRDLFSGWVRTDLRGAITALTEKIPEELRTEQVIHPFCYSCAQSPVNQVLQLAEQLPDQMVVNKFLSLAAISRRNDIPGALQLLKEVPECKWREQAVSGVTKNWLRQDVPAVERWLWSLPRSLSRDSGAATISRELAKSDPSTASAWALTIRHPEWRTPRLESAVQSWVRKDRRAAIDWLANTQGLSDEEREKLMNIR